MIGLFLVLEVKLDPDDIRRTTTFVIVFIIITTTIYVKKVYGHCKFLQWTEESQMYGRLGFHPRMGCSISARKGNHGNSHGATGTAVVAPPAPG